MRHSLTTALVLLVVTALAACGSDAPTRPPTTVPTAPPVPSPSGTPLWLVTLDGVAVEGTVAAGLRTPSAVAFLPDGAALVSERDTGRVMRVTDGGQVTDVGTVPDVVADGDGGLLGLAIPRAESTGGGTTVYAYLTTADGNQVTRMPFDDGRLGEPETVVDDIPAGEANNGGGLAVGPDGKLYVGTGEGDGSGAQDRKDLGGKVLRLNPDGSVPKDNPFRGSPVWSLGHRDVTGLAFDGDGGLWATESGQQRFQELNRIERGKNYGWPRTEGKATGKGHVKAFFAWRESESTSPSGLAIVDDVAYVADLRGGKLWTLPLDHGGRSSASMFGGLYGPLRTVAASPSGQLWLATSNRDGTATPSPDDDRILRLSLSG